MSYQQGKYPIPEIKTNSTTINNQAHISNSSFQNQKWSCKLHMIHSTDNEYCCCWGNWQILTKISTKLNNVHLNLHQLKIQQSIHLNKVQVYNYYIAINIWKNCIYKKLQLLVQRCLGLGWCQSTSWTWEAY